MTGGRGLARPGESPSPADRAPITAPDPTPSVELPPGDGWSIDFDAAEALERAAAIARHRPTAVQEWNAYLVSQYGSLNNVPSYKGPESSEYERNVGAIIDRRILRERWDATQPLPPLLPFTEADWDVIEARVDQDEDGSVRTSLAAPLGRRLSLDDRVEVRIEPVMRLASGQHEAEHVGQGRHPLCLRCGIADAGLDGVEFDPEEPLFRPLLWALQGRIRRWLTLGRPVPTDVRPRPPEQADRLATGSAFLTLAEECEQVWGALWQSGEALTLAGPPGVGKSTLAQQVVRQLIDDSPGAVLGQQVACFDLVVYLAMDRPQQIARSMRRTFSDVDPELLDDRLAVWSGPPPEDVAARPEALLELVLRAAGGELAGRRVAVVIDSLKDAAVGLVDDTVGASYNRARQLVLAAGVEVLELHHLVKRGANGAKPTTLADVYGSAWITAGAGSVVLLWGEPGDPIIELRHLKSPSGEVGPLQVAVDHASGTASLIEGADLLAMLRARPDGLTAQAAAVALFSVEGKPSRAQTEKARRRLESLVTAGHAYRHDPAPGSRTATVWTALTNLTAMSREASDEEVSR